MISEGGGRDKRGGGVISRGERTSLGWGKVQSLTCLGTGYSIFSRDELFLSHPGPTLCRYYLSDYARH